MNAWNRSVAALGAVRGMQYRLLLEPIPEIAYKKGVPGTNSLGLYDEKGGLVIVALAIGWVNASDDALIYQVAKDTIAEIDKEAKKLNQHFDYKYLNYASPWQKVIRSYGVEDEKKLKAISKKYDPQGVFQKNVPGGFKIF